MKKLIKLNLFIVLMVCISVPAWGQIFRPSDPLDWNRYGKSPSDGLPFLRFDSPNQQYYIGDSQLNSYLGEVSYAFSSWNNAGPVDFTSNATNGLEVTAEAKSISTNGPAWYFIDFDVSSYVIDASKSNVVLNKNYIWSSTTQDLYNNKLDVQSMVVHEVGHIHGLSHPIENTYTDGAYAPTMAGGDNSYFWTSTEGRSLEEDDILGTRFLQLQIPTFFSDIQTAFDIIDSVGVGHIRFTSAYTLSDNITIESGSSLTIESGNTLTLSGSGQITIDEGAQLFIEDNVIINANETQLTLNGEVTIGDNFTMKDGNISQGQNGSITFEGSAELQFIEVAAMPPLYQPGYFDVRGDINFSNSQTVLMRLSPNSSVAAWEGITVYSSASGATLEGLDIDDSQTGIFLSSTDVDVLDSDIEDPTYVGVHVSGGSPYLENITSTGNSSSGLLVSSYANADGTEINISGGSTGIEVDNATYYQINGDIYTPGSNPDVTAVDGAYANFNGTIWGGSPKTYNDGSATIVIQNPNNPLGVDPGFQEPVLTKRELLKTWHLNYRQNPAEAITWLKNEMTTYSTPYKALANVLLVDAYLSRKEYSKANTILSSIDQEMKENGGLETGTYAMRNLQLALSGIDDEILARQSLQELKELQIDDFLANRLEQMVNRRYREPEQGTEEVSSTPTVDEEPVQLANYPNPFNPSTSIKYSVPSASRVKLEVYNIQGQLVATLVDEQKPSGQHEVRFDASNLSSGVYFYRVTTGNFAKTNKFTLIK